MRHEDALVFQSVNATVYTLKHLDITQFNFFISLCNFAYRLLTVTLEVKSKIWITINGKAFLGDGRCKLLKAIDADEGSITSAAKKLGVPYRRAWSYIDAMEKRLGARLVIRSKEGSKGGETTLMPRAKKQINLYEELVEGMEEIVDTRCHQIMGVKESEEPD